MKALTPEEIETLKQLCNAAIRSCIDDFVSGEIAAERSRWEQRIKELEEAAKTLPDLYVYEKDNQGTYFLRNTKTQIVSERNSNGGHVEAMCNWLNNVYREGAWDAAKASSSSPQE